MTKIEVFPDNTGGKQINRDKLEEFLKQVRSAMVTEHITGNDSASVGFTKTLAILCQKLFNELEDLKEKTKGVEPT